MALATSETSARVGRGLFDHRFEHLGRGDDRLAPVALADHHLLQFGTRARSTSTPRSPRATMIPSATWTMLSKFSTPCVLSILAMTRIWGFPSFARSSLIDRMWCAERMKEAATKSTSCSQPNLRSSKSFCVRAGSGSWAPGDVDPFAALQRRRCFGSRRSPLLHLVQPWK